MVDRALKKFLPPVFDLKAYDEETLHWTYKEWWNALLRRRLALEEVELQEYADPGITSGHGSPEFCEQQVRALLPHLFEKQKMNEAPVFWRTTGPLIKSMEIPRAVLFLEQAKENPTLSAALDHRERSGFVSSEYRSIPVHPILQETQDPGYNWVSTHQFLVEVNLHAPDVELRHAFDAWLKSVRETFQIFEPSPKALGDKKKPTISEKRMEGWWKTRVLAFLDLYIYNRLHNPPPNPPLWEKDDGGWMSYRGEKWQVNYLDWIKLLDLDPMTPDSFRHSVRQRALNLLEPEMLELLEVHAKE